ncbi:hypothetical protein ACFFNY_03330 [Paenibacillus hodogayensis]|uniref:Uncharacterized protein n=1 Tax=Paenibacillus hodogayensis TaxID=279208 RepID=A0ABV5VQQ8_9BACL
MAGVIKLTLLGGYPKSTTMSQVPIRKGSEPNTCFIDGYKCEMADYNWLENGSVSTGKIINGAIIGGLLTGGAGSIIGAGIGALKKKDSSVLVISIVENGNTLHVQFKCDKHEYQSFLRNIIYA